MATELDFINASPYFFSEGQLLDPDIDLVDGKLMSGKIPKFLGIGQSFLIYSLVNVEIKEYQVPTLNRNSIYIQTALGHAQKIAEKIKCEFNYSKNIVEVFRGIEVRKENDYESLEEIKDILDAELAQSLPEVPDLDKLIVSAEIQLKVECIELIP